MFDSHKIKIKMNSFPWYYANIIRRLMISVIRMFLPCCIPLYIRLFFFRTCTWKYGMRMPRSCMTNCTTSDKATDMFQAPGPAQPCNQTGTSIHTHVSVSMSC
jgi:hypothetical protein